MIVDPAQTNYMQAFVDNFEWAVPTNALKWDNMEHNRVRLNLANFN